MASSIKDRIKHAWNAFASRDDYALRDRVEYGYYGNRPDRVRFSASNERSIITSIFNRIGIDVAAIDIWHVRLDKDDRFLETIPSGLQECLTVEANIDQGARAFRQDMAMSLFENGHIVIVPIETDVNPIDTGGFDVRNMRVGRVTAWGYRYVRVEVYNEKRGLREEITLPKKMVAIVENPLYTVMNEPNSTLQRLIRKLNLLDVVDEASSSGKMDLIIQLPYVIKSDARRQQAEQRRKAIEDQLKNSTYGIAYTDGTEKITQLNRPAENNMLSQVQYLTDMLYGQLGITKEVMDGTADEKTMLNYFNRTVEPVVAAIAEAMKRSFLTKTARSQKQSIMYFRDPFKLVPISEIAEIADKFTRNEIVSSNEIRGFIGMRPSKDPKADKLVNSNMPTGTPVDVGAVEARVRREIEPPKPPGTQLSGKEVELQNGSRQEA